MTIREELEALKNDEGLVIAEDAMSWAKRHAESELHQQLEWDDEVAGLAYRIAQVRRLIASHVTTVKGERKLVSLSIDRPRLGGGYRDIDDIVQVKALCDVLLDDALKELERAQVKYARVKELSSMRREVERKLTRGEPLCGSDIGWLIGEAASAVRSMSPEEFIASLDPAERIKVIHQAERVITFLRSLQEAIRARLAADSTAGSVAS